MVPSFPLCLGRHNGEVTSARICQTLGVPRQSRGLTSIELARLSYVRPSLIANPLHISGAQY